MEVIPAIDIRGGKAVRLFQGDYDRETVFNDSPVDAAQRWLDMDARRLHVVDLDGAKTGEQVNIDLVGADCRDLQRAGPARRRYPYGSGRPASDGRWSGSCHRRNGRP